MTRTIYPSSYGGCGAGTVTGAITPLLYAASFVPSSCLARGKACAKLRHLAASLRYVFHTEFSESAAFAKFWRAATAYRYGVADKA